MKEVLACGQCEGVVCADIGEKEKVIGQPGERRWVTFPENVADCERRKPRVVFDNMLGWIENGERLS